MDRDRPFFSEEQLRRARAKARAFKARAETEPPAVLGEPEASEYVEDIVRIMYPTPIAFSQ